MSRNEIMNVWLAGNSVKNWVNLPINNPEPNLHNINAHIKFGKNIALIFIQIIIRKQKYGWMDVQHG